MGVVIDSSGVRWGGLTANGGSTEVPASRYLVPTSRHFRSSTTDRRKGLSRCLEGSYGHIDEYGTPIAAV